MTSRAEGGAATSAAAAAKAHGGQPPISAVFLVVFDHKIGYSIAYKRTIPDLELSGVVEYKSLPSGLHTVHSDLVYFIHDDHAGVSAFVRAQAAQAERSARFAAVGVLVPLTYGRLGRAWLHAEALRGLALHMVDHPEDTGVLDEYWEAHRMDVEERGEDEEENGDRDASERKNDEKENGDRDASEGVTGKRTRAMSDAAGLANAQSLSPDHPAMSLTSHLDSFGPLLFPLYRAALLRKRILVLTHAPVREACDLVYNISVLSNIPARSADLVHTSEAMFPIKPLFNVGVHDIDHLSQLSKAEDGPEGYIACSTDEILATKQHLYDLLVEMPQRGANNVNARWPRLRTPKGEYVKATQRDLRRYRLLRREVQNIRRPNNESYHDEDEDGENGQRGAEEDDQTPLVRREHDTKEEDPDTMDGVSDLVEPSSWAAVAAEGFLWWASAGEKESWREEEACQDYALLADLPFPSTNESSSRPDSRTMDNRNMSTGRSDGNDTRDTNQAVAMVLIAVAQRLTTMILESMAELVDAASDGDEESICVESEDLRRMGLDVWSEADGEFARGMFDLYFDREAHVRGRGVECCGVRLM